MADSNEGRRIIESYTKGFPVAAEEFYDIAALRFAGDALDLVAEDPLVSMDQTPVLILFQDNVLRKCTHIIKVARISRLSKTRNLWDSFSTLAKS